MNKKKINSINNENIYFIMEELNSTLDLYYENVVELENDQNDDLSTII